MFVGRAHVMLISDGSSAGAAKALEQEKIMRVQFVLLIVSVVKLNLYFLCNITECATNNRSFVLNITRSPTLFSLKTQNC